MPPPLVRALAPCDPLPDSRLVAVPRPVALAASVTRTTFGALPMGAIFFRRARFWRKQRLYQGFAKHGYPQVGAKWLLNGAVAWSLSPDAVVWVEQESREP